MRKPQEDAIEFYKDAFREHHRLAQVTVNELYLSFIRTKLEEEKVAYLHSITEILSQKK